VVLESGNAARAATLAERLREAVAERTGGTVSIGIYCGVPESADEAVRIADDAKRRGKDRVVVSL
jgi:GGDEF domain-containing protein